MLTLPTCAEMGTQETALVPCGLTPPSNMSQFPAVWVRCTSLLLSLRTVRIVGLLYLSGQNWYFIHIILEHVLLTTYNIYVT